MLPGSGKVTSKMSSMERWGGWRRRDQPAREIEFNGK